MRGDYLDFGSIAAWQVHTPETVRGGPHFLRWLIQTNKNACVGAMELNSAAKFADHRRPDMLAALHRNNRATVVVAAPLVDDFTVYAAVAAQAAGAATAP